MLNDLFVKVVTLSLSAALIAVLVTGLRLILRKAPKAWVCALWALVAVRLLIPTLPESKVSVVPQQISEGAVVREISARPVEDTVKVHEYEPGYAEIVSRQPMLPVQRESVRVEADADEAEKWKSAVPAGTKALSAEEAEKTEIVEVSFVEVSAETMQAPKTFGNTVLPMLSVIWLAGVGGMLLYMAFSTFRIWRKVQVSAREAGNVWLCDGISSPFILGVIRPRIYLPSSLADSDKAYVLAHEQAHLKRLDHVWKPLGFLLLSVYWFNPVMWIAYILLCRDIEMACDEKVIGHEGEGYKKEYSEALLACSAKQRMVTACPLAFGEVGVKTRIKSVLNYRKPAFWILAGALVISLVAAGCALTNPKETKGSEVPESTAAESTAAESEAPESTLAVSEVDVTKEETLPVPTKEAETTAEDPASESTPAERTGLFRNYLPGQEVLITVYNGEESQTYSFDDPYMERVLSAFDGWETSKHRCGDDENVFVMDEQRTFTLTVNGSLKIKGMWKTWSGSQILRRNGNREYYGQINGRSYWLPEAFIDAVEAWYCAKLGRQYVHLDDFGTGYLNGEEGNAATLRLPAEGTLPDTLGTAKSKREDVKSGNTYYIAALDLTVELPAGYYLYRVDGMYRDQDDNPLRMEFVDEYILALRELPEEELVKEIYEFRETYPDQYERTPYWVLWNFKIVHKDYLAVEQLFGSQIEMRGEIRQAGDYLVLFGSCPWWVKEGALTETGEPYVKDYRTANFSPEYVALSEEFAPFGTENPDWEGLDQALVTRYDWPLKIYDDDWFQDDLMEMVFNACSGSGVDHYYYWRADGDHSVSDLLFSADRTMTSFWKDCPDASLAGDEWWNDYCYAVKELSDHAEKYAYPGIELSFQKGGTYTYQYDQLTDEFLQEQAWQCEGWIQDTSEDITVRAFVYAWLKAMGRETALEDIAIYLKQSKNDARFFLAFTMNREDGWVMTPVKKGVDYLYLADLNIARSYVEQYVK